MTKQFENAIWKAAKGCWQVLVAIFAILASSTSIWAADVVKIGNKTATTEVRGKILVRASDGGVLLLTPVGVLLPLGSSEVVEIGEDDTPFTVATQDEAAKYWIQRLPQDFDVYTTAHFVVLHNASRDYARWCGTLLERLYSGFTAYFSNKGLTIERPLFPLVIVVFATRQQYIEHCRAEVGDGIEKIKGHYNLETNLVTTYDLTGSNGTATAAQIARYLTQPAVRQAITTLVHEATHQLANNTGVTWRWTDTPQWVSEGLAMFFETPDLRSARGWSTVGALNYDRLQHFRSYLSRRPSQSLANLIRDNSSFQNLETAPDAYAEAWALTYFLLQQKSRMFMAYLNRLREKPPLVYDNPETRIEDFRQAFGGSLEQLEQEFLRYVSRLR
ncbi:MAG: DUF1570 domain-containing protein [Thermogutta sp.]